MRVTVFVVLLLLALAALVIGPIMGDQSRDGDFGWLWWIAGAFVLGGIATAVLSVPAVLWYVVAWAGLAVVAGVFQGFGLLIEVAGDFPAASSAGGFVLGGLFLIGAPVAALTGHPWWALIGLVLAVNAIGLPALWLLEDGDLAERRAWAVVIAAGSALAVVGLALTVLGPWTALTVGGNVFPRVLGALTCVFFGGSGLWGVTVVVSLYRRNYPARPVGGRRR
ncbi:hypothetical protein [Actinoplanes sp. NBRC 103695]|uniref:hypothetical protein n=1 Tax=Actinoplanes sp. NBRC 103695 TaxID=3032202 RepID=UPI0025554428|nr:hypothetical protein [Actinoplanes sp. NBRC 103695]